MQSKEALRRSVGRGESLALAPALLATRQYALRHTCITWLMQSGEEINEVSSFTGVSVEEQQRTYWHHLPDFQKGVATEKMAKTPGRRANSRAKTAEAV